MQGDEIGAGLLAEQRRLNRARVDGAARLAQGGDMVDVDAKAEVSGVHVSMLAPRGPLYSLVERSQQLAGQERFVAKVIAEDCA